MYVVVDVDVVVDVVDDADVGGGGGVGELASVCSFWLLN